jgi:cation diffusion facilitator family transporter
MAAIPVTKRNLTRYAWLSILAAVLTIGLKTAAYLFTDSVGLLSDALESVVNLVGALMALAMLTIAARPEDEDHAYGHSKAEYFSSGVEGSLIVVAAISIGYTAIQRIIFPKPLEQVGLGLAVSVAASLINFGVSRVLLRAAGEYQSITLKANANHLLTDVWTSAGVLVGVGAVALTGWNVLDSVVALVVAVNIIRTGVSIVRQSVSGLMDVAWPAEDLNTLNQIFDPYLKTGLAVHAVRSRVAGARKFLTFHLLVPDEWTISHGHEVVEKLEADIQAAIPNVNIVCHMEPLNGSSSWNDTTLDKVAEVKGSKP